MFLILIRALTYEFSNCSLLLISRADKSVMASSGFQADVKALQKHLAAKHLVSYCRSVSSSTIISNRSSCILCDLSIAFCLVSVMTYEFDATESNLHLVFGPNIMGKRLPFFVIDSRKYIYRQKYITAVVLFLNFLDTLTSIS